MSFTLSVSRYPELEARKIEKWSKIIHFVIGIVTPMCWVLPKFILNLFVYVTNDLETVEFELPLPMW